MNMKGLNLKLTAIFSADVVGHGRLIGEDAEDRVKALED